MAGMRRKSLYRPKFDVLESRLAPATRTWDGGALLNDRWTDPDNWIGNVAPVAGDDLVFPTGVGALDRSTRNDFSTFINFGSITIEGTDYTLSGNKVRLNSGENIRSTATTGTNTIRFKIDFLGVHRIETANQLVLEGAIKSVAGAQDLVIDAGATGRVVFAGTAPTSFGPAIHVRQGTLELRKPTGVDAIRGPLVIGDNTAIAPATVEIALISNDQLPLGTQVTLHANANGTPSILDLGGSNTENLRLTMAGGQVLGGAGSRLVLNDDLIVLEGDNLITSNFLDLNGFGNDLRVGGTLTVDSAITNGALHLEGGGRLIWRGGQGNNTYTGPTIIRNGIYEVGGLNFKAAIPGDLTIGANDNPLVAGIVFLTERNQIADSAFVTVNETGSLHVQAAETIAGLLVRGDLALDREAFQVNGSVTVQNGATVTGTAGTSLIVHGLATIGAADINTLGNMTFNSGLDLTASNVTGKTQVRQVLASRAAATPSVIAGELIPLSSANTPLVLDVADGSATRDLRITAVVKDATGASSSIRKNGAGTLALNGDNTFTGFATVTAGTLLVNGNAPTTRYRVNGGVLGGTGTVNEIRVNLPAAVVNPGQSPGTLKAQKVDFQSGGTLTIELDGLTPGTQHDQLDVLDLSLGREATSVFPTLDVRPGFNAAVGNTFKIVKGLADTGVVQGFFRDTQGNVLGEGATFVAGGQPFSITYEADNGDAIQIQRLNSAPAFRNRSIRADEADRFLASLAGTITEIDTGDSFFLDVDWGDGSGPQTFAFPPGLDGQQVNVSHRYSAQDKFVVDLLWRDQRGGFNRDSLKLHVRKG
jgi:autotransporter-associated beta strand protein